MNKPFKIFKTESDLEKYLADFGLFTNESGNKEIMDDVKQFMAGLKSSVKMSGPCEGCSTDCYNYQIGDCR